MEFRIADTFADSLAKLTGQEQKAVKATAFDLQLDPASPGMKFHKLDRAKDPNFWSVRVNEDIRLIVHRSASSLLLAYVDHHDRAYRWASRRKIERHPKTGAAQLVEVRETVERIRGRKPVEPKESPSEETGLFAAVSDDDLLGYGVPPEWLGEVRAANEDTLLELVDRLPQEAAEALLDLAIGKTPQVPIAPEAGSDPFDHPDAQRRFRVLTNVEELEQAFEFPWDKWIVFLHPAQRRYVEQDYNGPARISGSAGTGKTIVALHRVAYLARRERDASILLTTFSKTLANTLQGRLSRLIGNERSIAERIHVHAIQGIGYEVYSDALSQPNIASADVVRSLLKQAAEDMAPGRFSPRFLLREWSDVVDAWQLKTWEEYRDVARLGRKTRIGGKQREALWSIFELVRAGLAARKVVTWPEIFTAAALHVATGDRRFDFAVVDEAQDLGVAELRFLAALGSGRADGLFFTGDLGQRIFQQPFSWKSLGVDLRGRSHTLRMCYRTSHQIRRQADFLLPGSLADVDGIEESRTGTISVFNGSPPCIDSFDSPDDESMAVSAWISKLVQQGLQPHEIGVIVRDKLRFKRATAAIRASGLKSVQLSDSVETKVDHVSISTMHLAKGLEFRAVAVMACDDEVVPLQERIETISDESDLEEVYNTERHLLYVACTRARDHLLVTGVEPVSEFLDDMNG